VKTDTELKALYLKHAPDMLPLTGDQDATFLARESVELSEVRQRVDCVVKLRRGGEVYYRHIEFQGENDTAMAERCFLYNSRLQLQLRGPVRMPSGAPTGPSGGPSRMSEAPMRS